MPFQRNHIYPLKEPARYDDDLGTGYDHALLADYGPIRPGCRVHDAWIVNATGEVHLGLAASPVPVRLDDVDVASGRPYRGRIVRAVKPSATRLLNRLRAIEEALIFRLAGEIEADGEIETADYDAALDWTSEQIARRTRRR